MLIIPLGDPLSINIEKIARLIPTKNKAQIEVPIIIIGSFLQWLWQLNALGINHNNYQFTHVTKIIPLAKNGLYFYDIGGKHQNPNEFTDKERGALAVKALESLRGFTPNKKLAVLTCPIDKYSCQKSGFLYPGQTEYFENIWKSSAIMILAGSTLKVGLATNHVPLEKVARNISILSIIEKCEKLSSSLRQYFNISRPNIGICGLNPHCGERGLCGEEELDKIIPAIKILQEQSKNYSIMGPLPADTIFWKAKQGEFDGILAMYHDQGLGPLKTIHFDDAVNISGGLPHLRISPDHGPAKDLFLSKNSSSKSFDACWKICLEYLDESNTISNILHIPKEQISIQNYSDYN